VDFKVFLEGVLSTGYRGPLVSHNLPAEHASQVPGFLRRMLAELGA
jgi:hypothetical protein